MSRLRFGALFAVAAITVAACGGSTTTPAPATQAPATQAPASTEPGTSTAPAPSESAPAPAQIKEGGTLVVAIPGDIKRTDSALVDDGNSGYVFGNIMEGLVGLQPGSTSKIIDVLATSHEVSADGLTYTFKLRSGVKFHDGTDFNAAAVAYNYNRWTNFPKDLQGYSYYAGAVFGGYGDTSNVASVTATDASTITIVLRKPSSSFLLTQTLPQFGIASPTALKAGGADNTVTDVSKIAYAQGGTPAMVGTGPFKWEKWVKGSEVDLVKNADYWDPAGVAHLARIVFKPISDETAILNGLQAGDIDLAQKVSPVDIEALKTDPKFSVIDRGESCNLFHLGLNQAYAGHDPKPANNSKILTNLKIRQAIGYAINRQALLDNFYAGQGTLADNWMPPATQFYKPLGLPTYDPEKAKALIAESGIPADQLVIHAWYPSDVTRPYMPDPKGIFQSIQNDLEAVGFKLIPDTATWSPTYLDSEYGGKYEMFLIGWTCDWAGPDNFLKTAFFGYVNGKPSTEFGYKNDALDKAMNDALAAPDEASQKTLWEKAQDLIAADLPTIPIINSTPPGVTQLFVKGFVPSGNLDEQMNTVWLDK
jgi:peptide/nickel transport system substrate-binding protein